MERHSALAELIDAAITAHLDGSEPTAREVADSIIEDNADVIREFGYELAVRQIRAMVSARMKKVVEINNASGQQFELPLEIDGIPPAISFGVETEDGFEVRYIALSRATELHLQQYRKLLKSQITADSERLMAVEKLCRALSQIFRQNDGITVREACDLYRAQGRQGAA